MARYRHYKNHGEERQWVFVTTTCLDFVHAFREPRMRDLMAASLIEDLKHYGSTLHAFVVMPHHVHFIAMVPEGKTIGWLMNRVKSNAARRILPLLGPETLAEFDQQRGLNGRSFWQRSFRSFVLTSEAGFLQKVQYIHDNPVRAGLVESSVEYGWSSARLYEEGMWGEEVGLRVEASEFAVLPRWDRSATRTEAGRRNPQPPPFPGVEGFAACFQSPQASSGVVGNLRSDGTVSPLQESRRGEAMGLRHDDLP